MTPLSEALLNWYREHQRQLPWRGATDPYAIWISEIMLQQTRVETVIPYFQRWMERFPTVTDLASASQQAVLSAWEGLGYYSRARNLHAAAQLIVAQHAGQLPQDTAALKKLPGVGRYTAGAIASIAFGQDEPTLDGNIRRVFARLFNLEIPAQSPEGEKRLWAWAAEHLPAGNAGDYNQALMDLGATLCTPRTPDCPSCPLGAWCQAHAAGVQEQRPVLRPRPSVPHYTVTAAVIERAGQVLIARRPAKGLLGGLWEFPGGKQHSGESLSECLKREIREELDADILVGEPYGVYHHAYTHFRVTLHAFCCSLTGAEPRPLEASELRWVLPSELSSFPMGKLDRQIAARLQGNTLDHSIR